MLLSLCRGSLSCWKMTFLPSFGFLNRLKEVLLQNLPVFCSINSLLKCNKIHADKCSVFECMYYCYSMHNTETSIAFLEARAVLQTYNFEQKSHHFRQQNHVLYFSCVTHKCSHAFWQTPDVFGWAWVMESYRKCKLLYFSEVWPNSKT